MLDDGTKEQLCRDLLAEFGVTHVKATAKGELIHSCPLPFGQHRNGDRNPSASLNFRKLTFNCLGCGSSGGLLWFIAALKGETTEGARDWLNAQTGLGQTVMDLDVLLKILDKMYAGYQDDRPPIPRYSPQVLKPWTWNLFHPYMTDPPPDGRGIPESTLEHFRIGYAEEYFDGTERIIFPLFWQGELVGWQARRMDGRGHDKYRNSPDFPRERAIYNYDNGNRNEAIVVESPASVLSKFHCLPAMQATFGAKVTDDQIRLLHRYPIVTLWFDNDEAGWNATRRVSEELARHTIVNVVDSPYAADPAEVDDETAARLVRDAVPSVLWSPPTTLIPLEEHDGDPQVRHG